MADSERARGREGPDHGGERKEDGNRVGSTQIYRPSTLLPFQAQILENLDGEVRAHTIKGWRLLTLCAWVKAK